MYLAVLACLVGLGVRPIVLTVVLSTGVGAVLRQVVCTALQLYLCRRAVDSSGWF